MYIYIIIIVIIIIVIIVIIITIIIYNIHNSKPAMGDCIFWWVPD